MGVVQGGGPACLPSNPLTTGGILNTFVSVSSLMRDEGAGNVHWSSFIAAAVVTVTRYTSSPIGWTHSFSLFFFLSFSFFYIYNFITCTLKISTWFLNFFYSSLFISFISSFFQSCLLISFISSFFTQVFLFIISSFFSLEAFLF